MVLEISRLFRLKTRVPKWPCHSTYIFIAIIFVHRTWHLHWRVSSSWVDYAPWPMLGWKGWTFWMFQDRTKFSTFSKLGKWSDEMQGQGNFREKVERVEEEWGKVERVEEEWGKVERVEEEWGKVERVDEELRSWVELTWKVQVLKNNVVRT